MLTQIFIKPDGCKTEYTKIASHSFVFKPLLKVSPERLFLAGNYVGGVQVDPNLAVWSTTNYNVGRDYLAGSLTKKIKTDAAGMGIPIPINLLSNDTITLTGTLGFPYALSAIVLGYELTFIIGVYQYSCKGSTTPDGIEAYTFVPILSSTIDEMGVVCFNQEVTLGSNYDLHDTKLLVGCEISAVCPSGECLPISGENYATVSYTLDVQRPCQVIPSDFIIRNCCEGSITELVHIPGLVVGNFHVDNEGNCWEVIEQSNDTTNFTRTFTDIYNTCLECQNANPCPANLKIESCCVEGQEYVTGSLPGLTVGDTFVDNYGLCWTVSDETGAPISEESITVDTIITGDCETCKTANPCPYFYGVQSCCAEIGGVIAVPNLLNEGDAFVDTNGICWRVTKVDTGQLPTIYGIEVDTVYPYQGEGVEPTSCDLCIAANPCPTEYFITIKSCCDTDRVEVAQVPADYMIFYEGFVFSDYWGLCWEVTSFSTTGTATFEIWPWSALKPDFSGFDQCESCLGNYGCSMIYQVKDCQTDITYDVFLNFDLTIGAIYPLSIDNFGTRIESCFEVLGYAYPTYPNEYIKGDARDKVFLECIDCLLNNKVLKKLEVTPCCGGPNEIIEGTITWSSGIGSVQAVMTSASPGGPFIWNCYTLVGLSTGTPTLYTDGSIGGADDCPNCIAAYGVSCG